MVSTQTLSYFTDCDAWLAAFDEGRSEADRDLVRRACELTRRVCGTRVRPSGERFLEHALATAEVLAGLRLDAQTIAAALLHDAPALDTENETGAVDLEEVVGAPVARLVEGVQKMSRIHSLRGEGAGSDDAESLRKLFLSVEDDVRAVLIKLAERTHDMRVLKHLDDAGARRRIAQETLDLYAPLANRLGIGQLKWELEDLSFRHLESETYQRIARLLDERRVDREDYIATVIATLRKALGELGINAQITGRPKHIYSIWRKMLRKDVDFERIYDVRAVRVLVDTLPECYQALGVVHGRWQPIPGEFDDYIAKPKNNLYQSLHTAVIGPQGKVVEVQIRTHDMHQHAELGVAAHWRYKEGSGADADFDRRVRWLRQILDLGETADPADFLSRIKDALEYDTIHVFTPRGQVVDLPRGATPLDFAYHIHTEVGHRCRGAKVNGRIVPITYSLQNGQQVEILTAKQGAPSRDWMNPSMGYLHTASARAKVRQWFKQQHFDAHLAQGRGVLERELQRLGLPDLDQTALAGRFNYTRSEDLLAALGRGDVTLHQVVNAIHALTRPPAPVSKPPRRPSSTPSEVKVQGVAGLVTHFAKCCNPTPGDAIVGHVTLNGVAIHRADCPNLRDRDPSRLLDATWSAEGEDTWTVDVRVTARDRRALLRDVTAVVADEGINLLGVNTATDPDAHEADMHLTLEVHDLGQVSRALARIESLPGVSAAQRLKGA